MGKWRIKNQRQGLKEVVGSEGVNKLKNKGDMRVYGTYFFNERLAWVFCLLERKCVCLGVEFYYDFYYECEVFCFFV